MIPVLRDYQNTAIKKLRVLIGNGLRKIVMVLPTGGGKAIIFGQIISNAVEKEKTVLWLVHRRNLVYQMRDVLDQFEVPCGLIMSGVESDTKQLVQLGTIQTYYRRLQLDENYCNRFYIDADLLLIDEGHRSLSKTYIDVINNYSKKIIISCTATPMRSDQRGMGEVYESIADISNVKELTKLGYLAPARYFAPSKPDLEGVKIAMGDYVIKQLDEKINKKKLNGDIVDNWLRLGEDRKTIVFAVNVKHSIAIRDEFISRGIPAEHLDAKSSDEERNDVFRRMRDGDTRVVTNVGLYQEGLDVPDVSCIVMARPTKSMGLYRQCCGRGLRPSEGKTDCLIIDHGGVIEEHGFLDDEIMWSLHGKEIAWKKAERKKSDPMPAECRVCNEIFVGQNTCPVCGTELKSFGKKIEATDEDLVELNPKKTNRITGWDDKRKVMGAFVWHAYQKGYKHGWAVHSYKDFFGVWPNDARVKNVGPIKPEGDIKNLLTHILIKKAKRYKKKLERVDNGY